MRGAIERAYSSEISFGRDLSIAPPIKNKFIADLNFKVFNFF